MRVVVALRVVVCTHPQKCQMHNLTLLLLPRFLLIIIIIALVTNKDVCLESRSPLKLSKRWLNRLEGSIF